MIHFIISLLVAALVYWLALDVLHLPQVIGIIAAILVLLAGIAGLGSRDSWR